jgi:hypothetical protein
MLPLHFLEDFDFWTAFLGFPVLGLAGSSNVASTVREICSSVTPLDTAFRTAFLMRFTAFFCFSFPSAIDYARALSTSDCDCMLQGFLHLVGFPCMAGALPRQNAQGYRFEWSAGQVRRVLLNGILSKFDSLHRLALGNLPKTSFQALSE